MLKLKEAVPNVFGAKLSGANTSSARNYLRTLGRDFALFAPVASLMPTMLMGVKGSIAAGQAMILPEVGVQMVEAIWAKDYERAVAIQMLLIDLNEKLHPLHQYGKRDTMEGLRIRGLKALGGKPPSGG